MTETTEVHRHRAIDQLSKEARRSVELALVLEILGVHVNEVVEYDRGLVSVRCTKCSAPAPCEFDLWAREKCAEHGSLIYLGHSAETRVATDDTRRACRADFD